MSPLEVQKLILSRIAIEYCKSKEITFTRSRPYKKNDQARIEQKNGAIVRGYTVFQSDKSREPINLLMA